MPNTWSDYARNLNAGVPAWAGREHLDGLAKIAARLCECRFAVITLADTAGQTVVGRTGIALEHVGHDNPFLAEVMRADGAPLLTDARSDARFSAHAMTVGAPFIRFFAGIALIDREGRAVGTLCAFGTDAERDPGALAGDELQVLAKAAMAWLERARLTEASLAPGAAPATAEHAMNRHFETLADALPQMVWSTDSDGQSDYFSAQWCHYTGSRASACFGTGWLAYVHRDDVRAIEGAWQIALASGHPFSAEYRLRGKDGTYRWMLARGLPVRDDSGRITRWVGTCTDIDERVRSGDLMEITSRELSHRIKNLFSVVQALIAMALRKHPGMEEVSQALQARMVALGQAHDLIRPHIAGSAITPARSTMRQLIEVLIRPFVGDDPSRLELVGDDPEVDERGTTPLGLFFHEMALNSARFGALSRPQGRLRIVLAVDEQVTLDWHESGGPPVAPAPQPGFGLSLTRLGIERQLAGTLVLAWLPEGLHARAQFALRNIQGG
jgi:PAS domain S-box-containing protein